MSLPHRPHRFAGLVLLWSGLPSVGQLVEGLSLDRWCPLLGSSANRLSSLSDNLAQQMPVELGSFWQEETPPSRGRVLGLSTSSQSHPIKEEGT